MRSIVASVDLVIVSAYAETNDTAPAIIGGTACDRPHGSTSLPSVQTATRPSGWLGGDGGQGKACAGTRLVPSPDDEKQDQRLRSNNPGAARGPNLNLVLDLGKLDGSGILDYAPGASRGFSKYLADTTGRRCDTQDRQHYKQAGLRLQPVVTFGICVLISGHRVRYTRTQTNSAVTFDRPLPTRRNYVRGIYF